MAIRSANISGILGAAGQLQQANLLRAERERQDRLEREAKQRRKAAARRSQQRALLTTAGTVAGAVIGGGTTFGTGTLAGAAAGAQIGSGLGGLAAQGIVKGESDPRTDAQFAQAQGLAVQGLGLAGQNIAANERRDKNAVFASAGIESLNTLKQDRIDAIDAPNATRRNSEIAKINQDFASTEKQFQQLVDNPSSGSSLQVSNFIDKKIAKFEPVTTRLVDRNTGEFLDEFTHFPNEQVKLVANKVIPTTKNIVKVKKDGTIETVGTVPKNTVVFRESVSKSPTPLRGRSLSTQIRNKAVETARRDFPADRLGRPTGTKKEKINREKFYASQEAANELSVRAKNDPINKSLKAIVDEFEEVKSKETQNVLSSIYSDLEQKKYTLEQAVAAAVDEEEALPEYADREVIKKQLQNDILKQTSEAELIEDKVAPLEDKELRNRLNVLNAKRKNDTITKDEREEQREIRFELMKRRNLLGAS